jgi:chorismate mutase
MKDFETTWHHRPALILLTISIGCEGPAPQPAAPPRSAEVRSNAPADSGSGIQIGSDSVLDRLKQERIAIVDQVALWKWIHDKPIEDPQREARVLDSVEKLAGDRGLDREKARLFFESLMADARKRQQELHTVWKQNGPPATTAEIDMDSLRREIDRLTPLLLDAWGKSQGSP